MKKLISINEVSKILGVTITTLRRWDKAGKFRAVRAGERGHRYYRQEDLDLFTTDLFTIAEQWASAENGSEPNQDYYCSNISIFQYRLSDMGARLKAIKETESIYSLLVAVAGEIGNNSFDHNLGNWPDIPGIFFVYDLNKKSIVLADRGIGILASLKRVLPNLKSHREALKVAFTEIVTGRSPESRGNGLKFVRKVISQYPISLKFRSGDAELVIETNDDSINIRKIEKSFHGCLALIKF